MTKPSSGLPVLCLAFAAMLALGAGSAFAATTSVTVSVKVVPPVAITVNQNLRFGSLTPGAAAANVTITPPASSANGANIGTRVASNAAVTLIGHTGAATTAQTCNATSACGAAVLTVTGGASSTLNTVTISPPASLKSGSNSMAFASVTRAPSGTLTLSSSGSLIVDVGGTLTVNANQPAGNYTGTINITLDY